MTDERNLRRLDRLMNLFARNGVLDEYSAWWQARRRQPDYPGGLSGQEIMDWVRTKHPELAAKAEKIIRS
jgi:hypothetical protein